MELNINLQLNLPEPKIEPEKPNVQIPSRIIYLAARQMGKTTRAIERFMESPFDTVLITHNEMMVKEIERRLCKEWGLTRMNHPDYRVRSITRDLYGIKKPKRVICDEYLFWTPKQKSEFSYWFMHGVEILIYTTLDQLYDLSPTDKCGSKKLKEQIKRDPDNLIFDPLVKKIKMPNYWKFCRDPEKRTHYEDLRYQYTQEEFKLNFENLIKL